MRKPLKIAILAFEKMAAESQGLFPKIKNVDFAPISKLFGGGLQKVSIFFHTYSFLLPSLKKFE